MPSQYGNASDLDLVARLKIVAKLHGFGMSASKIASELSYSVAQAKKDVAAVIDRHRDFDDLDSYLKDVTARTGEQLSSLMAQKEILWKQLDWAKEWVAHLVQMPDGSTIPERDAMGELVYGPRKPQMVPTLISQIQSLDRQIADVLGLMHKNVDITVTLQKTESTQVIMLDIIKEASPEIYAKIVRQIQAVVAASESDRIALTGGRKLDDIIEADYVEVESA